MHSRGSSAERAGGVDTFIPCFWGLKRGYKYVDDLLVVLYLDIILWNTSRSSARDDPKRTDGPLNPYRVDLYVSISTYVAEYCRRYSQTLTCSMPDPWMRVIKGG